MTHLPSVTENISMLASGARPEVLTHLLRLSEDDLRFRFLRCMTAASIEAHVASIDFEAAVRLGIRRQGRLVALVEGFIFGQPGETVMEVAFSTEPTWRRLGLARALGEAIADLAARRGVVRIVARCDARNAPMKSLLQAFEAAIEREDTELCATWTPPRRPRACQSAFESFGCATRSADLRVLYSNSTSSAPSPTWSPAA